jgi:putative endopeptidase
MQRKIFYLASLSLLVAACKPTSETSATNNSSDVSTTRDGLTTINKEYLNQSIRPQDDFFNYANGTWCKNNPVPDVESRWGSFNELDQRNKVF